MVKDIDIKVEPNPIVNLGPDREMCIYDTVRLYGDVLPSNFNNYTYAWSPTANIVNIYPNEVIFNGTSSAVYTLNVTTPAGCIGSDNVQITVWPVDFAAVNPAYKGMCPGDSILYNIQGVNITGITWEPQTHLTDYNISNPICYPTTSLIYTIYVQDNHTCVDTLNAEVFVAQNAVLDAGPNITLYPGDIHSFNPNTNCITVNWKPSAYLSATNIPNPVISNATVSQQYVVNGVTDYGCVVTDTVEVTVDPNSYINLPNAFTPGSQTNPKFSVDKLGLATLNSFRIYNRWGNLVYESTNILDGWDGRYKDQAQPMDTYIYSIDAVTSDGKKFQKTGNVLLIR
jgi:gliding motility-associated-like protein